MFIQRLTVMGIRGMTRLLTNYQKTHPYLRYRAKIIAIDVNILIYKFCHMYNNLIALFLKCFVYKICSFLKFGIFPVFIFDGDAPVEKHDAIKKRFNMKRKYREKLEELLKNCKKTPNVTNYMKKLERQSFMVTKYHRVSLIRLLECLKLPFFIAEGEAEVLCVLLQRNGQVDYTLLDDTDTIAYGCNKVLRMFRNCERYLMETDVDMFLKSKVLTPDEFLNVCVLSGCDYLNKVSNIELEQCIGYVKRFHTLEKTLTELKKTRSMYSFEKYKHIKDMYQFKTDCTQRIINQHKDQSHNIVQKLEEFSSFTDSEFQTLTDHLKNNAITQTTERLIMKHFKECRNEFLLIRKNFFSTNVKKSSSI